MAARLGVNIDHVATVRQARGVDYPDPVAAAAIAEMAGADQITVHIRMDRRHIQERDIELLGKTVQTRLNVEMAATDEMMAIARELRPDQVTLVPEREGEVTTEGGLDLKQPVIAEEVAAATLALTELGIQVAIFADPELEQVDGVVRAGAGVIELNTAAYADAGSPAAASSELRRIEAAARRSSEAGLFVAAGHGLHFHNIQPLVALGLVAEYNIGHSLVARAIFSGLGEAVRDMKRLLE